MIDIGRILEALELFEKLKCELRHSWLSSGRRESVAEHCWQMSIMAMLVHRYLQHPVDLSRSLRMVVIHDLVEAIAGDVPFFEDGLRRQEKCQREKDAMSKIRNLLDEQTGKEIESLWLEFEESETGEAKFVRALDNLEVQMQHNLADFATWEEPEYALVYNKMDRCCAHDSFLRNLCRALKLAAEEKMRSGGVDVAKVRRKAELHG